MKTSKMTIKIKDIYQGYISYTDLNDESEILAYNNQLIVRPAYQREFIYTPEQQSKVIESVINNFPLNTIFIVKIAENKYELLDGQQRTLSICEYLACKNSFNFANVANNSKLSAENLKQSFPSIYENILNYDLDVCICEGDNHEKLKWFDVINTAGERLNAQELKNAIYTGPWLTSAKRYFGISKNGCKALIEPMINGHKIVKLNDKDAGRQLVLELALKWKAEYDNKTNNNIKSIDDYMNAHRNDVDASDLIDYWKKVVNWVFVIFGCEKSDYLYMNEIVSYNNWGNLFNMCSNREYNSVKIQQQVDKLMMSEDSEIQKKSGIFEFVLTGDTTALNLRKFPQDMKNRRFRDQKGICANCQIKCDIKEMEGDHITPWIKGGKTIYDNLQMLCVTCNRKKSSK